MSNLQFSKEFEDRMLEIESERSDAYNKDVAFGILSKEKELEFKEELKNITFKSSTVYEKMLYVVFIQTLLLSIQTLVFIGIYFKL
jgi:hypothetical protein